MSRDRRKPPRISDHAIVRYVERVIGVERSEIEAWLLTPEVVALARKLGDGCYTVEGSHKVVVEDGTVTTVLPLRGEDAT